MSRRRGTVVIACAFAALTLSPAAAEGPIIDLGQRSVSITTGFAGSDVLLFGAVEDPADIVVVVRGPAAAEIVRRKSRTAGFWLNRASVVFGSVPGFYHLASTRPVAELLPAPQRALLQIGSDTFAFAADQPLSPDARADFTAALIRRKQRDGLYDRLPGTVEFLGNRLFRTTVSLPSNVPTGTYTIDVFQIRGGAVDRSTIALTIAKVGFEARVFDLAQSQGLAYGAIAIAIALMAGWLSSIVFRSA